MATVPDTTAELPEESHAKPPFLRRVKIRNYKSIAYCDVPLGPLTVIVGRNGSGKSNFLDALGFLKTAITTNLTNAVRKHGGLDSIRCQMQPSEPLRFEVEMALPDSLEPDLPPEFEALKPLVKADVRVSYGLSFNPNKVSPAADLEEDFSLVYTGAIPGVPRVPITTRREIENRISKVLEGQKLPGTINPHQILSPDALAAGFLGTLGGGVALRLRKSCLCNPHPDSIRRLQRVQSGRLLLKNAANLVANYRRLRAESPDLADRVRDYLAAITEQVLDVWPVQYGEYETLRFKLDAGRGNPPLEFDAASMSDGTLRVLAALVAVFQVLPGGGHPSLVGIEEPETALHPAASRALVDALDEATMHTQVVITTHSADILDDPDLEHAIILVARYNNGRTELAPVDAASREIVKDELNTYGGMLRTDQLEPDYDDLARQDRDAKKEG